MKASLIGVALVAFAACSGPTIVDIQADFSSYDESTLFSEASLIAEGTVLSLDYRLQKPRHVPGDTPEEDPYLGLSEEEIQKILDEDPGVPMTVVTLRVNTVHKGVAEVGKTITVVQLGGIIDGIIYRSLDEPPLVVGEKYLLFAADSFDSEFAVLGGSAGTYRLANGEYVATDPERAPFPVLTPAEVAARAE